MTQEEILALPVGYEMDAVVAENVLGWSIMPADPWPPPKGERRRTTRWEGPKGCCYGTSKGRQESGLQYPPLPRFSTDIAAAWRVVEKLRERFSRVEIDSVTLPGEAPACVCMVEHGSGETWEHYVAEAEGATAPEAICRAALLAVMVG